MKLKRTTIYFLVPLILVAVFSAYYYQFSSHYAEQQAAIIQKQKDVRMAKLEAEAREREAAIHDAVEAQKVRKAERAARDARERQQRDDRENAHLEADKALQESQKLQRQSEKLEKDVASAKDDVAKVLLEQKQDQQQISFLKEYTAAAQANQQKLAAVVQKIEAADAAIARAAALAAAKAGKQ